MAYALLLMNDQVVVSLTTAFLMYLPPILIALGTLWQSVKNGQKSDAIKTMVNGRMEELLKITRENSHREGKEAGIKEIVDNGQVGIVVGSGTPVVVNPAKIATPIVVTEQVDVSNRLDKSENLRTA